MHASQQPMNVSLDCSDSLAREGQALEQKAMNARALLRRLWNVLTERRWPALLYRLRRGENPYDFSQPQTQRTYLSFQRMNWN